MPLRGHKVSCLLADLSTQVARMGHIRLVG
jgi:hypothetical protein